MANQKYQNATRTADSALFIEVGNLAGQELNFKSKVGSFTPAPGFKAQMVTGSVRVSRPSTLGHCETECTASVLESVELRFNVQKGANASLAQLKDEVVRVFEDAVSTYYLSQGLVPPTEATFTEENGG